MQELLNRQQNEQNASDLRIIDIRKKKQWTETCEIPIVIFDIQEQQFETDTCFLLLPIRFKPALHDTSDAIMHELTHQYAMIKCVECC